MLEDILSGKLLDDLRKLKRACCDAWLVKESKSIDHEAIAAAAIDEIEKLRAAGQSVVDRWNESTCLSDSDDSAEVHNAICLLEDILNEGRNDDEGLGGWQIVYC